MNREIKQLVNSCIRCKCVQGIFVKCKFLNGNPENPLERFHVDLVGPFKSPQILIAVDSFNK